MTAEPYAEWWEIEDAPWDIEEREAIRKLLSEVAGSLKFLTIGERHFALTPLAWRTGPTKTGSTEGEFCSPSKAMS